MSDPEIITDREIARKLPCEAEHLQALERMRSLDTYYRWTCELIRPYIGRRIVDAGCGVGNFTELLAEVADLVLAVDLSPQNLLVLRERFRDSKVVEVVQVDLEKDITPLAARSIDTIVCLDTLEHVEDDVQLLRQFRKIVQPGGHLLLKVPAGMWLYGSIDRASGHYRRYSVRELREKGIAAGWEPVRAFYMNIFGVMPYWLKSRVLKRSANFSRTFPPGQFGLIRRLIPVMRVLDRLVGPPVGLSAILIARRSME